MCPLPMRLVVGSCLCWVIQKTISKTVRIASLLGTQALGRTLQPDYLKGWLVCGTVCGDRHFNSSLGSIERVGYCIRVTYFYLVFMVFDAKKALKWIDQTRLIIKYHLNVEFKFNYICTGSIIEVGSSFSCHYKCTFYQSQSHLPAFGFYLRPTCVTSFWSLIGGCSVVSNIIYCILS